MIVYRSYVYQVTARWYTMLQSRCVTGGNVAGNVYIKAPWAPRFEQWVGKVGYTCVPWLPKCCA